MLAVEGWGEAVVEVKKVGRGERRMEGVVSLQGKGRVLFKVIVKLKNHSNKHQL